MKRRSPYEVRLGVWLSSSRLPAPVLEYAFAKEALARKWRIDYAWPAFRVGVEVDGGARLVRWQRNPRTGQNQPVAVGRHGQAVDYEKLNAAAELGWRILRFNPEMMRQPDAVLGVIERTLRAGGWPGQGSTVGIAAPTWSPPAGEPGTRRR